MLSCFVLNLFQGGDSNTKRVKLDEEIEKDVNVESHPTDKVESGIEENMASTSEKNGASTSDNPSIPKIEKSGFDQLPKELHKMKIKDDKTDNDDDDKVQIVYH